MQDSVLGSVPVPKVENEIGGLTQAALRLSPHALTLLVPGAALVLAGPFSGDPTMALGMVVAGLTLGCLAYIIRTISNRYTENVRKFREGIGALLDNDDVACGGYLYDGHL